MTISGANYREGVAYNVDGAMYVAVAPGGTISNPTITGPTFSGTQIGSTYPIAVSFAAVSSAGDTAENTVATITIPANALGANGALLLRARFSFTNNANVKTVNVRYSGAAGTIVYTDNFASNALGGVDLILANRNATSSQVTSASRLLTAAFSLRGAVTSAIDTTASTTVVITFTKATAGDTMTLEGYTAELLRVS